MHRNINIIPLSKDHHQGLLFCWKIRQGIRLGIAPERMQPYVGHFWNQHLQQHFREEENVLFAGNSGALCQRAQTEHREIEKFIMQAVAGKPSREQLARLADLVDAHIRFEERELFPHLESTLTQLQLHEIGTKLQQMHAACGDDKFRDEFWLGGR